MPSASRKLVTIGIDAPQPWESFLEALAEWLEATFATLIIAVVMFTVSNTVSASILERTTEIGTIRALGLRRSTVMKLFLLEATMLALIGTLLGIAGSVSMELVINALQLTWFPPGGSENLSLTVSVFREFGMVVIALMMAVVFSTLAAVPAANKAARLKIVDALRFT